MEIIEPSIKVMDVLDEKQILTKLELCGRTAYKSEDKITEESAARFVRGLIKSGHHSVLEHVSITVRIICDRGVSHELVRHRIAAYTQESTRYVNYNKRGMEVIRPCFWDADSEQYHDWCVAMACAEDAYDALLSRGAKPQEARSVLPNSLKTEIVATMNIREWRYVLNLRTQPDCHPQMRQVMNVILVEFKSKLPVLFGDVGKGQ